MGRSFWRRGYFKKTGHAHMADIFLNVTGITEGERYNKMHQLLRSILAHRIRYLKKWGGIANFGSSSER